jgi:hypothetical protein
MAAPVPEIMDASVIHHKRFYCWIRLTKRHVRVEFPQIHISCVIHRDANSSNRINVFPSYYLQKLIKCLFELFFWFQIRDPDTRLLNWSVWKSCLVKEVNIPVLHRLRHILWWIQTTFHISTQKYHQRSRNEHSTLKQKTAH